MVLIENLLEKPIWVRRNNGASLNITPGMPLVEVSEAEWRTNPALKKLAARGALRERPRKKPQAGALAESTPKQDVPNRPAQAGESTPSTPTAETKQRTKPK